MKKAFGVSQVSIHWAFSSFSVVSPHPTQNKRKMAPIGIGVVLILLSDLESGSLERRKHRRKHKRLVNANKCKNKHIRENLRLHWG